MLEWLESKREVDEHRKKGQDGVLSGNKSRSRLRGSAPCGPETFMAAGRGVVPWLALFYIRPRTDGGLGWKTQKWGWRHPVVAVMPCEAVIVEH